MSLKLIDNKGNFIKEIPIDVLNSYESAKSLFNELGKDQKSNESLIFSQANSFALVASEIFHKHLSCNVLSVRQEYLAPFMVNSSFACELFLKTIHINNHTSTFEKVKKKHNLKELFLSLPEKIQNQLQLSLNVCATVSKAKVEINLANKFLELENAFVDWRYLHEKSFMKAERYSEIILILNALYNSSIDLKWYENMK